jgi:NAD(P)-dependent dehydrogenase (short-subunit alcohol dehydrogenase family)
VPPWPSGSTLHDGGTPVSVWDVAGASDLRCDITDPDQIDAAVERTLATLGRPTDITITAGIGHGAFLLDATPEDFDRVLATNTRGPWLTPPACPSS